MLYWLNGIFSVVDITGFHVSLRKTICEAKAKQFEILFQKMDFSLALETEWYEALLPSRAHRLLYHITAVLFYWIFSTPLAAFVVALYLFVSVNFLGLHYTEAFSSMRMEDFKNFLRCHIDKNGVLSIYSIGVEKVPRRWQQDTEWTGRGILLQVPLDGMDSNNLQPPLEKKETIANNTKLSSTKRKKKKKQKKHQCQKDETMEKRTFYNVRDLRGIGPSYTWEKPSRWVPKEEYKHYDDYLCIMDYIRIP